MDTYDIVMIVVLIAATLFGAWKGLAWQVASLAAIVASYYVAFHFRDEMAEHIHTTPPWNMFIAMLILYVGTSFVIWVIFRLVSGMIDRVKLKEFDRQIGALFGFAKGILLCVIITLFAVTLLGEEHRQQIVRSKSGYYIALLLDKADRVLPQEVQEVLDPYIHDFDEKLQVPGQEGSGPSPFNALERAAGNISQGVQELQEAGENLPQQLDNFRQNLPAGMPQEMPTSYDDLRRAATPSYQYPSSSVPR